MMEKKKERREGLAFMGWIFVRLPRLPKPLLPAPPHDISLNPDVWPIRWQVYMRPKIRRFVQLPPNRPRIQTYLAGWCR